jgi:parallel beta-helix repeat protein
MLTNNTVSHGDCSILLEDSSDNMLTNNTASNNNWGIYLVNSSNNTLTNNTVSNSVDYGIVLFDSSSNNMLTNNTASNNDCGIYLEKYSSSNILTGNNASNNDNYGIYLCDSCDNNSIYNNYFNNTHNAWADGNNIWNITKTLGTNIIGGPYLGGNYWSDYAGNDTDGDGLGDTLIPYNSTGNIANGGDYLPLVPVQKPTVSITTDKFSYKTGDTITIIIDINNPTENIVTFGNVLIYNSLL